MSKTNCGIFNTSKIKSKNRYGLNRKYKGKDKNKKDDMSYRLKCKNNPLAKALRRKKVMAKIKSMKEAA
jgi:hypothetical protein